MPRPLSAPLSGFTSALAIAAVLAASTSSQAQNFFWDPNTDGNGLVGGTGIWDLTNTFWDLTGTDAAVDNVLWPNSNTAVAVFQGTPGVVTLNNAGATTTANGLTFNVSGYTLSSNAAGDTLTLAGTTPTIAVNNGSLARINTVLAGTAGLNVAGNGTLILSAANTYAGQATIGAGATVTLNAAASLGAVGAGNETIVSSGGTLNVGGQAVSGAPNQGVVVEEFRIAGTGVGGIGALVNAGASQQNALAKVVLTGDATISAGTGMTASYNAGGQIVTTGAAGGRLDIRLNSVATGTEKNLDLAGFTLTKTGSNLLALVNVHVSDGNITVDEGQLNLEVGSVVTGTGTLRVNPNGKLGFWTNATGTPNVTRQIEVNGGTIGDPTSTSAAQTIAAPIRIVGSQNPNFTAIATVGTTLSGQITQQGFTGTEIAKRGGGLLTFSNTANTFSAPITIYAGTLRADYTTTLTGGVPPAAALTSTDTPLGTNPNIKIAGGTLAIRANMDNNNTNQVFDIQKNITVDLAPGSMSFDRIGNASQTDKHVRITSLTMAPASASNGWSIGQNQLTFAQGNTHRLEIPLMTMGSDASLATGDFSMSGDILSAGKNSLVHSGGNTLQFIAPGNHEFNAFFNAAGTLRVGNGFGTPTVSNTVTVGEGTVYMTPGTTGNWRSTTNIAAGQVIDATVSQRLAIPVLNFEQFTAVPSALRATGTGVYGIGSATYGDLDLSTLGDGTWRIGSNLGGAGNGTINGTITPGSGNMVRMGGGGTATVNGTNAIAGAASLEIGSGLISNTTPTNGTGTVLITAANNFTGGTDINRGSTLNIRAVGSLGSGPVETFGTFQVSGASGSLVSAGASTNLVNLYGGSSINLDSSLVNGVNGATMVSDRWNDTTPMTLNASNLTVTGPTAPNATTLFTATETIGALTVNGGSTLNLNRSGATANLAVGQNLELTVASLNRGGLGTLELVRNTGTGAGLGGGHKFLVTAAPAVSNGMITPWVVAPQNGPVDFLTYGASGVAAAAYDVTVAAPYTAGALNYVPATNTGGKINVTTGALTLVDNPSIYVLRTDQSINTSGTNNTITLFSNKDGGATGGTSGGAIIANNGTGTVTVAPNLVFNDGVANEEGILYTRSGGTLALTGTVTAAGLTKFGPGTLNLSVANPNLSGTFSVNQGTVNLFGPTTTSTFNVGGTGIIQLAGGQLNLRSNNTAVTGTINPTLQNGLTVAANIPTATIDLNRSGADTASSGTFIFNPAAAASPGLQLLGSPGEQGQTLNVSGANYSLQFGTNAANTFNGNVTINNAVNVTLNNGPTINGTNPVITKSGTGNLILGAAGASPGAANGTRVVMNDGTLELRSVAAVGTGATTSLDLNRGTLNLRRDSAGKYGTTGSGAGYAVNVKGATTISVDRTGGTGTNYLISIGKLTTQTNGTLTTNSGNGISLGFEGAQINGSALIASNIAPGDQNTALRFLSGFDVAGGALVKLGTGHVHMLNANSTYSGGTYVQQGVLRARAANALGTGTVYLNPGAIIDFDSANNLGVGQQMVVASNRAFLPMISVNVNGVAHPTTNVDTANAAFGVVGISNGTGGSYDNTVNLSSLYGGGWSFGGVPTGAYDPVYTGPSVVAGNGNLYRLGGGGTAFAMGTDSARAARTNVLTGPNDVRLGFDSSNILPVNMTNFQYSIAGTNDYSGGETVIHRGMVARLFSNNDGVRSGLSNSAVDVFGVLSLSGAASLDNGTGNVNAVTLHPGAALFLDSANSAANNVGAFVAANNNNRWNDSTPIGLNGAMINLIGNNNVATSETVGAVTYSAGARLRAQLTGTGSATLTLNSLTASGPGATLQLQSSAPGTLGAGDKIIVSSGAPTPVNGMISPSIVNATAITNNATSDQSFVTYGVNGFANVAYDKTLNATYTAGSLLPTDKVDVGTAALTLSDDPTVYALRTSQSINLGGPFNTITIRSGGFINHLGNTTINPHLVFNDGTQNIEARMYVGTSASGSAAPGAVTATITGNIVANGVTKFGSGVLAINVPQTGNTGPWTVNSGTLTINDPQGLGNSPVTLNAALTTAGQASQAFGQTQLNFNRDQGTSETVVFSGGLITVVNEATIRMGGGGDNKNYQIPAVTLDSSSTSSSVSLTLDVPNNRTRGTIPTLTLADNAIIRITDAGSTADTGRSVAAVANSLVGTNKELTKIGNRTLELPNDNSSTFTGGSIIVSQGTLRVRNSGSLGSATTTTTIERNATLEIDAANFSPAGTVNQLAGSIERWNRENARGTTYNLPAGVNLQLNTNLLAARTIGLNGGTIEGFLWTDHPASAVERTIGSAVTVNLLANSYVGQNIIQGQGYDAGRQPTVGQPFGDNNTGAFLRIDGNITGNFDLTKTGFDTVILAGANNTYGNTIVDSGTVRLGVDDALPTNKTLTTRLNGVLDLYGSNQTVAGLGTPSAGPNPGGVSVGSSGRITNSSPVEKTLTVNNTTNFTYNGNIERNVAVTKQGAGSLTLAGNNTYTGETVIEAGTLVVTGSLSGSETIDVRGGATFDVTGVTGGPYEIGPTQTLEGSGTIVGPIVIEGNLSPGNSPGDLLVNGALTFSAGSTLTLEIAGPNAGTNYDQVTVAGTGGPVTLNGGTVTLSLSYAPVGTTTYTVIDNLAATPITGTFANLADGGTIIASFNGTPYEFVADYQGGDGNDLVLTVPEPTSATALLAGLGICAGLRRFRRQSAAR